VQAAGLRVGHLLCDHDSRELEDNRVLFRTLELGDTEEILRVLPRIRYSSRQEQEAEMIASLVLEGIGRLPAPSPFTGLLAGLERHWASSGGSGDPGNRWHAGHVAGGVLRIRR